MDFYKEVPRDLEANLRYRITLRERCQRDLRFRAAMMKACKEDVLFWMSAFCWCYEPRPKVVAGKKQPQTLPFIPWKHQEQAIRKIDEFLGYRDIGAEKSRGEGMSWIAVLFAIHRWLFFPMSAIGLVSRNELAVDNPDDPDSLFWKIDWELSKLPPWMYGGKDGFKRTLDKHNLKHLANGSTITGYAATGDVASGGRKLFFVMDELAKFPRPADHDAMASTQQVTLSRFFISTPKGNSGAYYDLMHEPSNMVRIILDWTENETRNRGLYEIIGGKPVAFDPLHNPLPADYSNDVKPVWDRLRRKGFKLEGKKRSPWYDRECDRPGATPYSIAQELDRDYGGSGLQIFGAEFFEKAEATFQPPQHQLIVNYDKETLEPDFQRSKDGRLKLWCTLDMQKRPPKSLYVLGADIGSGLGGSFTSNSVAVVIDRVTMEQVAEYAINTEEPGEFADTCMAIAKFFWDAYLIWEMNYGGGFMKRVKDKHYPDVYYRETLDKRGHKKTKKMAWFTDDQSKGAMFGDFSRAVRTEELKIRSNILVEECAHYVLGSDGKIQNNLTLGSKEDASAGRSHADRVIAICVCLQGVRDRPAAKHADEEHEEYEEAPRHSMAGRFADWQREQQRGEDEWDDRGFDFTWRE